MGHGGGSPSVSFAREGGTKEKREIRVTWLVFFGPSDGRGRKENKEGFGGWTLVARQMFFLYLVYSLPTADEANMLHHAHRILLSLHSVNRLRSKGSEVL